MKAHADIRCNEDMAVGRVQGDHGEAAGFDQCWCSGWCEGQPDVPVRPGSRWGDCRLSPCDDASREELRTICNDFNGRRGRMQHADLKRRGWPIGPGHVEVVNKTHVGERMKRSGMRWSMAVGQAIPGIRSLIGPDRCDRSWEYIVEELKRRNPANDNWNHWKEKRRQLD